MDRFTQYAANDAKIAKELAMETIMSIVRYLMFFVSVSGYVLFAHDQIRIPVKFSWIFVLSSLACIVYFSGLLNIMLWTVAVIFLAGIALFLYYTFKRKLTSVFGLGALNMLNVIFCVAFAFIFASLVSTNFIHYDNFSHWGLIVKYLYLFNAFPDAASAIVDFKTYPLGSSSYLYYFCKIVGNSEGTMLIGQATLLFSCFYAMFGVIRDSRRMLLVTVLAICCSAMTYFNISIRINNLLVDFLLPLLALAALAAMFSMRDRLKTAYLVVLPILGLLCIVKNSGIFFAAICFFVLIYLTLKTRRIVPRKQHLLLLLLCTCTIIVSLVPFAAWNLHTAAVFAGENTKHSMNADNFEEVYSEKTPEVIAQIVTNFRSAVFSIGSLATRGILLCNLSVLLLYFIARFGFGKKWKLLKILILLDVCILLYYLGILAMFLFTMPTAEALVLAGFERYASSMIVLMIGGIGMGLACDLENSFYIQQGLSRNYRAFKSRLSKNIYETSTLALAALSALILLSEINGMDSMKASYSTTVPYEAVQLLGDNWEGTDEHRYLVYASDKEDQVTDYYVQYTSKYFLFAPEVDAISSIDPSTFAKQLQNYDYLIVLEPDESIETFLNKYGYLGINASVYSVSGILESGEE